jgi:drug/metabolite transporter (DMT)-like permease
MLAIALALASAVSYGAADFCGGHASRRAATSTVLVASQLVGLLCVLLVIPVVASAAPDGADLAWGAVAGVCGFVGLYLLYRSLALGAMSIVSPITAVVAAVVPVVAGLALGERPGVVPFIGIALALAAIALVSRTPADASAHHVRLGPGILGVALLAGLGFGLFFVALSRTSDDAGLWPLISSKSVSIVLAMALARSQRQRLVPAGSRALQLVAMTGVLDMAANTMFLLASRVGLLAVVGVISSLYPASTVALAYGVDKERLHRTQVGGLVLAAVAVVLIAF